MIVAWLALATRSYADCLTPKPMLLWSYPADGAVDVPTNAQLWVLSTLASVAPTPVVLLNGKHAPAAAAAASPGQVSLQPLHFEPSELDANTLYTMQVEYAAVGSQPAHTFELHFSTGAAHAKAGPGARISARFAEAPEPSLSEPCSELVAVQGCFDTIEQEPPHVHRLALAPSDAIAWFVRTHQPDGSMLWPSACGAPRLFLRHAEADECFFVQAISRGGWLAPETRYCAKASTTKRKPTATSATRLQPKPPLSRAAVEAPRVAVPEAKEPSAQTPPPSAAPEPESPTPRGLCAAAPPGSSVRGQAVWMWLAVTAMQMHARRRRSAR